MTKIALTAAALLVATGSAFAGSDHYGSDNVNQPTANQSAVTRSGDNIDRSFTASIRKPVEHRAFKLTPDSVQPESGQGIWGR
ncbi:DUF680 domain-containing protein [Mesorhizobium sp. VK23B]|uniref:DUF680 domain-containing protein n=1 Tax=Mesorhizobium dulcispinae TaxID=3072316 RepID=A0ABU4XC47_9HYPH|nr:MULTISPECIES: DUF680 domain-containing protein [unclassified Mesorhizobium]MDX8466288.1 DUF680 domain-containing protein [Mesorhizobium sp. VK23B]MDX8472098.1 DUF680 domain-containing protein [Mesorhizobium sp. VK23A]